MNRTFIGICTERHRKTKKGGGEMFIPEYYELQADFCSSCNVCTTCARCSACTVCLLDGPVPDAELGAVGCLGLAGRAVNIASW